MKPPVIDRVGFRNLISQLCQAQLGWSDFAVFWALDPNPTVNPNDRAQISLQITKSSPVGWDEHRRTLSDGTDGYPAGTYWVRDVGNREIMITARCQVFDAGVEATDVLETLRAALSQDTTTAALDALSLAFVWASSAVNIPVTAEDRVVNSAAMELELAGIAQIDTIISPATGPVIESVNIVTGNVT